MRLAYLVIRILCEVSCNNFNSLRIIHIFSELINLVKHMTAYPSDSLGDVLRNVFDFDINKPETLENLSEVLTRHG